VEQGNSMDGALLSVQQQQLDELRSIRAQTASGPFVAGREQTSFSQYSMNTGAAQQQASAQGLFMPTPNVGGIPLSPFTQNMGNSAATYMQQANLKQALFSYDRNRVSRENRDLTGMQAGQNIFQAGLAGAGALGGLGGDALGTSIFGGLGLAGGFAGGAIGGAIGGAVFASAAQEMGVQSGYSNYLFQNSQRFINPYESTNRRYGMGFNNDERSGASSYLRSLSTSRNISDTDMSGILSGAVDQNLLKDVTNLKTFKEKMAKLTDSVKTSALLLNETYQNVTKMMGELERAGVSTGNFDYMMGKMKTLGSFTGMNTMEATNSTLTVSGSKTGTAWNSERQIENSALDLRVMQVLKNGADKNPNGTLGFITNLYNNTEGSTDAEKLSNLTVRANRTMQEVMGNQTFQSAYSGLFNYNDASGKFELDQSAYDRFTSGNMSYADIMGESSKKMTAWSADGKHTGFQWQQMANDTFMDLTDVQKGKLQGTFFSTVGRDTMFGETDQSTIMAGLGIGSTDADRKLFTQLYGTLGSKGNIYQNEMSQEGFNQTMQAKIDSESEGLWQSIKKVFNTMSDKIGDAVEPMRKSMEEAGVTWKDIWNGTHPTNRVQFQDPLNFTDSGATGSAESISKSMNAYISDYQKYGGTTKDLELLDPKGQLSVTGGGVDQYGSKMTGIMKIEDIDYLNNVMNSKAKSTFEQHGALIPALTVDDIAASMNLTFNEGDDKQSITQEAMLRKYSKMIQQLQGGKASGLNDYEIVAGNQALSTMSDALKWMGVDVAPVNNLGYSKEMLATLQNQYGGKTTDYYGALKTQAEKSAKLDLTNNGSDATRNAINSLTADVAATGVAQSKAESDIMAAMSGYSDADSIAARDQISKLMDSIRSGDLAPEDARAQFNALKSSGKASSLYSEVSDKFNLVADKAMAKSSGEAILKTRSEDSSRILGAIKAGGSVASLIGGDAAYNKLLSGATVSTDRNLGDIAKDTTQGWWMLGGGLGYIAGAIFNSNTKKTKKLNELSQEQLSALTDKDMSGLGGEDLIENLRSGLRNQFIGNTVNPTAWLQDDKIKALLPNANELLNIANGDGNKAWSTSEIDSLVSKIMEDISAGGAGKAEDEKQKVDSGSVKSQDDAMVTLGQEHQKALSKYMDTVRQEFTDIQGQISILSK